MATVTIPVDELTQFDLPPVCVVTGERERVTFRKVNFVWIPPTARFLVVFCGLVGIVAMYAMQKKVQGELPFSEAGWERWRSGKILAAVGILGFIGLLLLGFYTLSVDAGPVGAVVMLGAFGVLVAAVLAARGRGPMCKRIDDQVIELDLPSTEAVSAFEERLRGGTRRREGAAVAVAAGARPSEDARYDARVDEELRKL